MKICLTGGTGFLGSKISEFFTHNGYVVDNITRADFNADISKMVNKIEGSDMIINLAGASILNKWTFEYKKEIYNSRIISTQKLVEAIKLVKGKPSLVMSASAVGIYDTFEVHDEFSDHYSGNFLAKVCKDWEAAIAPVHHEGIRLAIIRLGVVLDRKNGALAKMLPPFKLGAGAIIGDGFQPFPFIHIDDLLSAIWYVYKNPKSKGIYNMVAPEMVSNREFSMLLGKKLKRPVFFKVGAGMLKLLQGEGSSVLTEGQKVIPKRLKELDFPFQFPTADDALTDLLK